MTATRRNLSILVVESLFTFAFDDVRRVDGSGAFRLGLGSFLVGFAALALHFFVFRDLSHIAISRLAVLRHNAGRAENQEDKKYKIFFDFHIG